MKPRSHSLAPALRASLVGLTGAFVALTAGPIAAQTRPATTPPAAAAPVPNPAGLNSRTPVTLNLVNAEVDAVTRAISAMINQAIVVDPRVKGQITLYSEQPLSVRQAYLNYLAGLRGLGFALVENAGLLKVVPEADAKLQTGTVSVGEVSQRGDQILTQIYRLNHENATSLVSVLRPLISPNNTINANTTNNTLIVTDYADNLQRIAKIIAALDQPASTDVEIIPIRHAVASDIAALAQRLADGAPATTTPGMPAAAGSVSILADARSNSLVVRAPNANRMSQLRALIDKLDRPTEGGGPGGRIHVVHLKNADATRLATVLRAAFGSGNADSSPGATPTGSPPITPSVITQQRSAAVTTPVAATGAVSTGGIIQADPATNSLIITAPDPLYRQIRSVIDQLDSRRAQVFVESMIVKMDANKAAEFGFQWQGLLGNRGDSTLLAAGTNFGAAGNNIVNLSIDAGSGKVTPGQGLNLGLIRQFGGVYTLASLARFLESNTGANILSTPNLVALDNEEAKIVIGQNVPFVTGSFTNTGTNAGSVNPFQTVERKDVGLTLRIRSQIGENGTVRMTVFQENSAVVPGTTSALGPTTEKSSIETTVVVDDGQIMVLGGLLKDEYTDAEDRIPGLGAIPIVGNLFRSESRKRIKSNLMVFLRPVVLRTPQAAETLTMDRYDAIRAQQRDTPARPSSVLPINDVPVLPAAARVAPTLPSPAPTPKPN